MKTTTEKALIKKINLNLSNEKVRVCRYDSRFFNELGRYYGVDKNNFITSKHIDPYAWAADLKLI